MKKVLLASTALVFSAGFAAAEVTLSGSAEMGIVGGSNSVGVDPETRFHQDLDVTFTMSGESDAGITFGASVDIDETAAGTNNDDDNGTTVFISGAFGTLTMGDTDGAMDWALTEAGNMGNPGSIADDETSHLGYFGAYHDGVYDGQVLRYDNTIGDFGFAISVEMDDDVIPAVAGDGVTRDTGYAIGLKYGIALSGVDLALGLGWQSVDLAAGAGGDADIAGASVTASFAGGLTAGVSFVSGEINGVNDSDHIGVGIGYETGPISLHANYGEFDYGTTAVTGAVVLPDADGIGLSAAYDLGGGLSAHFGYGDSDVAGAGNDPSTWSLGLAMSF